MKHHSDANKVARLRLAFSEKLLNVAKSSRFITRNQF